jgi:hypothetical protein
VDDPGVVVLVHQVPLPGMAAIDEVLNRRLREQHSVPINIYIYIPKIGSIIRVLECPRISYYRSNASSQPNILQKIFPLWKMPIP